MRVLTGMLMATGGHSDGTAVPSPVERGEYLVTIAACNDRHTPFRMGSNGPEPGMTRMLSGHPEGGRMPAPPVPAEGPRVWTGAGTITAFEGPCGVSYSPKLTPGEVTGMGIWTEEIFIKAIRSRRHFGQSRPILPPMLWPSLAQTTGEDLKAIYAYLRSIPPIKNQVPEAQPAVPPAR